MGKRKNGTLSAAELSSFCSEVSLMLSSGMPLYDGMETLAATYKGHAQEDVYRELSEKVTAEGSLTEAMKDDQRWPVYLREMVSIGERTGRLEEVMNGLSEYYDREGRIRQAIVSAVTYPMVLGIMMVLIVLVLILRVLPVFNRVLNSMGIVMSASSSSLMQLGINVGWIVLALVLVLLVATVVCVILSKTKHRSKVLHFLETIFPPLKRVQSRLASSRIASVMSMMLSSGFPMDEALNMVPSVLTDDTSRQKVEAVRAKVAEGQAFEDALAGSGLFEEIHSRMIRMGIAAGRGDQVMAKVAAVYEEQAEDSISNLVSIIEPSLVALLSIVIGAVLLAVMLPMAGMISSLV